MYSDLYTVSGWMTSKAERH